jgi:hypothetical protein
VLLKLPQINITPLLAATLGLFMALPAAYAADVRLAWTLPTTYTDGSPLPAGNTIQVSYALTPAALASSPTVITLPWTSPGIIPSLTPGQTYYFKAQVRDSIGTLSVPTSVISFALTSYSTWQSENFTAAERTNYFLSGPLGDPDHDEITNLVEYALGADPKSADRSILPQGSLEAGSNKLLMSFSRPDGATDVEYIIESANSLSGPWSAVASNQITKSKTGSTEQVRVTDTQAHVNRFMRLRINMPGASLSSIAG